MSQPVKAEEHSKHNTQLVLQFSQTFNTKETTILEERLQKGELFQEDTYDLSALYKKPQFVRDVRTLTLLRVNTDHQILSLMHKYASVQKEKENFSLIKDKKPMSIFLTDSKRIINLPGNSESFADNALMRGIISVAQILSIEFDYSSLELKSTKESDKFNGFFDGFFSFLQIAPSEYKKMVFNFDGTPRSHGSLSAKYLLLSHFYKQKEVPQAIRAPPSTVRNNRLKVEITLFKDDWIKQINFCSDSKDNSLVAGTIKVLVKELLKALDFSLLFKSGDFLDSSDNVLRSIHRKTMITEKVKKGRKIEEVKTSRPIHPTKPSALKLITLEEKEFFRTEIDKILSLDKFKVDYDSLILNSKYKHVESLKKIYKLRIESSWDLKIKLQTITKARAEKIYAENKKALEALSDIDRNKKLYELLNSVNEKKEETYSVKEKILSIISPLFVKLKSDETQMILNDIALNTLYTRMPFKATDTNDTIPIRVQELNTGVEKIVIGDLLPTNKVEGVTVNKVESKRGRNFSKKN